MGRKRWVWIALPAVVLAVAVVSAASSGSGHHNTTTTASAGQRSAHATAPARPPQLRAVSAHRVGALPAELYDAAIAPLDRHRVVLLGGLDAADVSVADITVFNGTRAVRRATLPNAQHDAQAARLGRFVYVFGGGGFSSYDHILRYDPASGTVTQVGTLPRPVSDVGVAALDGTAYIVGGFDGTNSLDTIVAWRPGSAAHVVGHLPTGLRYAAVTADGHSLIIVGGTVPTGVSHDVWRFDPALGKLAHLGRLPGPLTHASAAVLDGQVLIVGGRHQASGEQTSTILAINPQTGSVRRVGHLTRPVSDAAAVTVGANVIVAGGENAGVAHAAILSLAAAP